MPNVFDQFDQPEQRAIDEPRAKPAQQAGNVFDQFDGQRTQPVTGSMTQEQFAAQYGDIPDIEGLIAPSEPKPDAEPTIGEKAIGTGEVALSAITGATSGTIGMIGGTLKRLSEEIRTGDFGSQEAADRIAESASELMSQLTYAPRTETGKEYIKEIGEAGEALAPLSGLAGPLQQIGQATKAALPQAQQAARTAARTVSETAKPATEIAKGIFEYQTPTKQRIGRLLEEGSSDVETAGFKLKESRPDVEIRGAEGKLLEGPEIKETATEKFKKLLDIGGPKIVKDKAATESIKQGFDEGVIAAVKAGSITDKSKMAKMVDIMQRGKKNKAYAIRNRPSDVVGDSLMERVKTVRNENKKSGKELGAVAENLKGQKVDSSPAVDTFLDDLDSMGVKLGDDLKPIFSGSDIEGVVGAENVIKNIVRRMANTKTPDGYDIHRLKKYIDEQVTYGKTTEGLSGKAESVLKSLRRNLDKILDEKFPAYDKVNTTYKETIDALDAIQDVAGRKMDLTGGSADKAVGTLLRRLMSNAQSRVKLLDSIDEIEGVATKYGAKFDDDLLSQTLFVDELDRVFGPVARTSLQGQVGQAVEGAARAATGPSGLGDIAIKGAAKAAEKARGINEAGAFKAIKDLLKEQ